MTINCMMHKLFRSLRELINHQSCLNHSSLSPQLLTSQEVSTALRPFYFVVHPDKFWNHPKEKDTNEHSLKLLNSHLDDLVLHKRITDTRVTFYVRDQHQSHDHIHNDHKSPPSLRLKPIHIDLLNKDNVNTAVHRILSQCKLSTEYLRSIGKQPNDYGQELRVPKNDKFRGYRGNLYAFWMRDDTGKNGDDTQDVEDMIMKKPEQNLLSYLKENNGVAMERLKARKPIREEVIRLCDEIKRDLKLDSVLWTCGWGISHFRGCLLSLETLKQQHSKDMNLLNGKTVVFGRQTGVSYDGHVILSIEDVRSNWLQMIRSLPDYDALLNKLPFLESTLSGVLRGIEVDHRKFRPAVMIKQYISQIRKLTSALTEYIVINGFPSQWPKSLENYQLVVECEAGPLMLSPTGQFIVPASCPAFLMIDFITDNMTKAKNLIDDYHKVKSKEINMINECLTTLGIESIDKDDNITPDLMIVCCEELLKNSQLLSRFLRGNRLRVSHYYSVLHDGEICIPWNFKL